MVSFLLWKFIIIISNIFGIICFTDVYGRTPKLRKEIINNCDLTILSNKKCPFIQIFNSHINISYLLSFYPNIFNQNCEDENQNSETLSKSFHIR